MLSSITLEGMGTSLAVEGATNREVFETYVEQILAPTLRRGQVVVMDNLTAHKGERVKELIEERGCKLIYLPPYSPDFNPIEEAFAKIKALVRKAEARTREALVEAIGKGISMVTLRMLKVSSTTAAILYRFNYYDECCSGSLLIWEKGSDCVLGELNLWFVWGMFTRIEQPWLKRSSSHIPPQQTTGRGDSAGRVRRGRTS
jgi:transposase